MKAKIPGLAAGLALALAAGDPARAQFMSSPYPVIIVPPPQVQNPIVPRPTPRQAQSPKAETPPPDSPPSNPGRCYQGRTNVCP